MTTFRELGLIINYGAGKTKAMVQYRGRDSVREKQRLHEAGGFPLPDGAGAALLRVVACYKHLGSMLADDGSSNADVPRRVNVANAAYAPLAVKIFGRSVFPVKSRLNLATALVQQALLQRTRLERCLDVGPHQAQRSLHEGAEKDCRGSPL